MKEASGELSMTLIVIIAAGVILTIFLAFRPNIEKAINSMWGDWANRAGQTQQNTGKVDN